MYNVSNKKEKIKLILVDDHQLFVDGLKSILESYPKFQVLGTAHNGYDAFKLLQFQMPDLVVLDLNMPKLDGQQTAVKLLALYPAIKILVISMHHTAQLQEALQQMGVSGFIPKDSDAEKFIAGIECITEGGAWFPDILGNKRDDNSRSGGRQQYNLTQREVEIIRLIRQNKTSQEISEILFLSPFTIATHRKNICAKLNLDGKNGLLLFSHQHPEL